MIEIRIPKESRVKSKELKDYTLLEESLDGFL